MMMLLGGYGNGDWLPFLGVLIMAGAMVQVIDYAVKYVKLRRMKKRFELEQTIINHAYSEDALDNFSTN